MIEFFTALITQTFLQKAILSGAAASIAGGVIGSYVVVKRIVFIAGSIAHTVIGGMGIALYLSRKYAIDWLHPIHGAIVSAILAAFLIGAIRLYYKQREDTVIGALWAAGMAIGVIFISLTPGYNVDIMSFLFGNILWAKTSSIVTLFILDAVVLLVTGIFHRKFLAICFDEVEAKLQKIPVASYYFLLLSLVALTVVLLIQVVGAILVIALLSLPPAMVNLYTQRLSRMMLYSTLLIAFLTFLGIFISYILNLPTGATIALTTICCYLINLITAKKQQAKAC